MDISPLQSGLCLLDKYRVETEIDTGATAFVHSGRAIGTGQKVAIKVMKPSFIEAGHLSRFVREAEINSVLCHPNICPMLDYGYIGETAFLVMPFIWGKKLSRLISKPISSERTIDIVSQVLRALESAHAKSVIHRDLKPSNIMVPLKHLKRREVKVMDFGVSKHLEAIPLTSTGHLVGTIQYMSPEQSQAKPVDCRSDLYSVGVVMYEMLTGKSQYGKISKERWWRRVRDAVPFPRPRDLVADIPKPLETVVLKAMARNPSNRYQSASQMREALQLVSAV